MKEVFEVTCETKMARIYDNDAPLILSRNEWTRDERDTLVSKKVWHLGRLIMPRLRLVVAMTLHKQLSSF
jgi:hypothetical protein